MNIKFIYLFLLAILVVGCTNKTKKGEIKEEVSKEISLLDTLQLRLNHGDKWLVNPETQGGVIKMNAIIKKFKSQSNKDYNALGKKLAKQTSYIIKNCNMVGMPHDQLHVVLVPMLEEISNLKDAKNNIEGETSIVKLESLISDYFVYFKL